MLNTALFIQLLRRPTFISMTIEGDVGAYSDVVNDLHDGTVDDEKVKKEV